MLSGGMDFTGYRIGRSIDKKYRGIWKYTVISALFYWDFKNT
jgi:hypothetical protein